MGIVSALLAATTLGTPAAAAPAPAPQQTAPTPATEAKDAAPAADQTEAAPDIVVYALKGARASQLQHTPAAITAVNAEMVERLQLVDLSDVGRLIPNAVLNSSGSYSVFPAFQIRGIGTALSTPTLDPAVTV